MLIAFSRTFNAIHPRRAVLLLLAACSGYDQPLETGFSVAVTKDDSHNIPSALEATANQFFRAPPAAAGLPARVASAAGGVLVDIDKDTLSPDGDTPFFEVKSSRIALRAGLEKPVGRHVSLVGGVLVSRGHSHYLLPLGVGVLVDPMSIRFRTTSLEVDAGLAVYSGRRVETRMEVGAGSTLTHTRTRITSALINVANSSTGKAEFVYLSAELGLLPEQADQPGFRLRGRVKYYPDIGVSLRSGVILDF